MWGKLNKNAKSMKHLAMGVIVEHNKDDPVAMALAPYQFVVCLLAKSGVVNENLILKRMKEAGVKNNHANIHDLLMELMSREVVYPAKHGYSLSRAFNEFLQEMEENLNNNKTNEPRTETTGP